jgi:hypothetical protein
MATMKCVLQFEQNHSALLVQWWFCTNYHIEAPIGKSIYKKHKAFAGTGCICGKKKKSGKRPSDWTVERVCMSCHCNPQKATRVGRQGIV